ncbi:hypothetical protein OSB04_013309 [Centaurea solstitialis]|uniref:CRM domain-containing protein n=1 Tax=Centaurea solstitialis TaxID=347529 RepID=A0AA38WN90_9ASTR|nr:hypothetical protein OSB04_013309 [Centaurea solstitialis]
MNQIVSRSFRGFRTRCFPSFFKPNFTCRSPSHRPILHQERILASIISSNSWWAFRNLTICRHYGSPPSSVRCVISEGKPKFEIFEIDPPKKNKFQSKKRLKMQRKKEKKKRRSASRTDPRRLTIKGSKRKGKFASVEERIKYKLEKILDAFSRPVHGTLYHHVYAKLQTTKIKEALLIERLKRYEVPKLQGPMVKPVEVTGEERFYMKKMAQKGSNYVPVGRRGVFGGVVLNMHMHWKKHETVKVICKPCKPGQIQEYANEIARLSGGIPIQIIGDDTIVFYRGKDYVQPEVMSPIDTLSKKKVSILLSISNIYSGLDHCSKKLAMKAFVVQEKTQKNEKPRNTLALEKSKYEQSLESARHFIAIAEKELELYRRHIALYGEAADHNPKSIINGVSEDTEERKQENVDSSCNEESSASDDGYEGDDLSLSDMSCMDESSTELDSSDEET